MRTSGPSHVLICMRRSPCVIHMVMTEVASSSEVTWRVEYSHSEYSHPLYSEYSTHSKYSSSEVTCPSPHSMYP